VAHKQRTRDEFERAQRCLAAGQVAEALAAFEAILAADSRDDAARQLHTETSLRTDAA
jgi:hypothetical protein